MRVRLCLEVERLGLNTVIMGNRGFGAARRGSDGKVGSIRDCCVHHCVCLVVVVRYPGDGDGGVQAVVDAKEVDGEEEKNVGKLEEIIARKGTTFGMGMVLSCRIISNKKILLGSWICSKRQL